ncbi:hypothetical protein X805_16520 [Sphaerotilus natans subsp. natans DSM 6575]|uniref:Uncharacterized protein n=1 Tax=Sphaerotilus natans subsp. natans DSM 6575 TaxID=1286631 RepID=A0A059KMS6_9BURK|nr:hypothetical protein X805_16520 [Sphaerotilus natans subsp. natans DSM 6575]
MTGCAAGGGAAVGIAVDVAEAVVAVEGAALQRHRAAFGEAAAGHMRGVLLAHHMGGRQRVARRERILLDQEGIVLLRHPGQRVQRQAVAHRRVAGHQVHALVAEEPRAGDPARAAQRRALGRLDRQHVADLLLQALVEDTAQAHALELVVQPRVERVDVDRQAALAPQVVPGVLIAGLHELVGQAQARGQAQHETLGIGRGVLVVVALVGEQRHVVPARLAVGAPVGRQRPARQLLARVPLALAEVQEAALAVLVAQALYQLGGVEPLRGAERVGVPLGAIAVVDRDEGRLAAHRQAHVARDQLGIDLLAQRQHRRPLVLAVGLGHARGFPDARDLHLVRELDLALVDRAGDRRRAGGLRRAGQRDVALAGQQARGRVQPDPARARQIDLAPGMQVGEVDLGAAGAIQGDDVGLQLDQVAGDEARGQAHVAQRLHQQPAGVATGARGLGQRLLRRLHARLEADGVADLVLQALVQPDQEVDRAHLAAVDGVEEGLQRGRGRRRLQVRGQFLLQAVLVDEGEVLGARLEEEVEGVVDRHLGHQIDGDLELRGLLREDQAGEIVRERILLPVDEMRLGLDAQRVRQHRRAAVRRRAQAHHLGRERHRPVIPVVGDVMESDVDGHGVIFLEMKRRPRRL